jgi:3-oxoacyl-[acyl-carrier protein] reductase
MGIKRKIKNTIKRIIGGKIYTAHSEYVIQVTDSNKRFEGKVAFVTGGSGEIGRAICLRLATEGAMVYVGGRYKETIEKVVVEIRQLNAVADSVIIDVTNEESITLAFTDIIAREGRIDILVNCAGGSTRSKNAYLYEQSIEIIDSMLNTNLRGSILCSSEAGKHMTKQRGGKIINIASIIGLRGKARFTDYAASKAGIIGYTFSLAIEMGQFGVNVNCVSPGFIQRGIYSDEQLPYLLNSNYLGKVGKPEDIALAVAFLASSDADFITGQNLCVDGGRSLGLYGDS